MPRQPKQIGTAPAEGYTLNYKPDGEILRQFMLDDNFVVGIRGPVGSGKSAGSALRGFHRSVMQKPGADGIKRARGAIIRNTGPELKTTTIKTWLDWFPEHAFGRFNWSPPFTHHIRKGNLDLEVIFLALDRDEDVKKLLSLELTWGWINEAREVPKAIVDGLTSRLRRYPSMKDGGPSWSGMWMDTNSMEPDHWWAYMSGDSPLPEDMEPAEMLMLQKPENWSFYSQPEAMREVIDQQGALTGYEPNPLAENMKNLAPTYYKDMLGGKQRSWINVYIRNKLGSAQEGKTVYPEYREEVHRAKLPLKPIPGIPIGVGLDFGLTPAAIFGQNVRGRLIIYRELVAQDMGAVRFSEQVASFFAQEFPGFKLSLWGDPAGDHRVDTDERTPYQIFGAKDMLVLPAQTNDPILRQEAVRAKLGQMVDGEPGFLMDPRCTVLHAGFARGYSFPKLKIQGAGVRYGDAPIKNKYSHPHDALQYLALGFGYGRSLIQRPKPVLPVGAKPPAAPSRNVFARHRERIGRR